MNNNTMIVFCAEVKVSQVAPLNVPRDADHQVPY